MTPAANETSPPALTEQRLWFLYCVAGLIKSGIESRTGWTRGQIDGRLRRWRLHMLSEAYLDAEGMRRRSGGLVRRRWLAGELSWEEIDAFKRVS